MNPEAGKVSTATSTASSLDAKKLDRHQSTGSLGFIGLSFHSGVSSAVLFLVAMLLYNMSIPLGRLGLASAYSWLNFWGALLFVVESIIDILWSVFCQPAKEDSTVEAKPTRRVSDISQASTVTARTLRRRTASETSKGYVQSTEAPGSIVSPVEARCAKVDWELLGAVFFLIPSIFYLLESLMDPLVVGQATVKHMKTAGLNVEKATAFCDWAAVLLFIFDACLRIVSRIVFHRTSSVEDRPILIHIWQAHNWMVLDWITWGDVAFLIGACMELVVKVDTRHDLVLVPFSSGLWTLDALFYVIGSIPALRLLREQQQQQLS